MREYIVTRINSSTLLTQSVIACISRVVGNDGQILQILPFGERMNDRFSSTAEAES